MAQPLRFRYTTYGWTSERVARELYEPLDDNLGATASDPWYKLHGPFQTRRFDMDNGDTALFAWNDNEAYWVGNTETPSALWRTDKMSFGDAPTAVAEWAERELLAELLDAEPWLAAYEHLARFFLPVLCSKDGRDSSRAFFRDHAAGFPDMDRDVALSYYESFLETGVLDPYRHTMAGKLGTSEQLDRTRMAASMSEFTVAKVLVDAGYTVIPEISVSTGHAIDFRAEGNSDVTLVEVTRPSPPRNRRANSAAAAIRETVATKTDGQLAAHGGGVTLLVDCSSFDDDAWDTLRSAQPPVGHRPAVVFRVTPGTRPTGYQLGSVPLELGDTIDFR